MNLSKWIVALVAALGLGACDTPAVRGTPVTLIGPAASRGTIANQGIVVGTGGSGAGVMPGLTPSEASRRDAESIYTLTPSTRNP